MVNNPLICIIMTTISDFWGTLVTAVFHSVFFLLNRSFKCEIWRWLNIAKNFNLIRVKFYNLTVWTNASILEVFANPLCIKKTKQNKKQNKTKKQKQKQKQNKTNKQLKKKHFKSILNISTLTSTTFPSFDVGSKVCTTKRRLSESLASWNNVHIFMSEKSCLQRYIVIAEIWKKAPENTLKKWTSAKVNITQNYFLLHKDMCFYHYS